MQSEEIQPCELGRYLSELQAVVEAVCNSAAFRSSPKSCQFLRHIVHRTLHGSADELKERLIGIALLGRDASYDTGSDAGVRVRANDVRKRLAAYYAVSYSRSDFTLDIPAGSYVPRFYMPRSFQSAEPAPDRALDTGQGSSVDVHTSPQVPRLPLQLLAFPTLVALFLCIICIRWQLAQERPFITFWTTVLQDHRALLYVPVSGPGEQHERPLADRLEDIAPLFNLAGQFHAGITIARSLPPRMGAKDIMILIGAVPSSSCDTSSLPSMQSSAGHTEGARLFIHNSPSGLEIIDRGAGNSPLISNGSAALLTIVNGAERTIHIDGTDAAAIDSLVHTMCDPNAFPDELLGGFQDGTVTQIVFPIAPRSQELVFHEASLLPKTAVNWTP